MRLSSVVNVDSNLDRRALVRVLGSLEEEVDRYVPIVTRIIADHEHAPTPPQPRDEAEGRTVSDPHGYVGTIERELQALGLRPTCDEARGLCTYELDSDAARNVFSMVVRFDPAANRVVVAADRFLSAPVDDPRIDPLLQRLLELNWEQLVPSFQWNAGTGEVSLSGVLSTDGNFDRRAFRGVVQAVHATAERQYRALRGVLNP